MDENLQNSPSQPTKVINPLIVESQVTEVIRTCYDPEIPVNIYEMGLIYSIKVDPSGNVSVQMTLTSPNCPAAVSLPGEVQSKVKAIPGIGNVTVEVVWTPTWTPSMMSEAAKLELGIE